MKNILVAGIGNIFFGDDAFGCEVVTQLLERPIPAGVTIRDFGIRSYDLAYAIMDADTTILVDATPQGKTPGTIFLIEPDLNSLAAGEVVNAHGMNPVRALQMVRAMGGRPGKLYLVGCEPAVLEPEEGAMGLSEAVQAAVPKAVEMIESLVGDLLAKRKELPLTL
jgi:hydrogenase maturation protease